MRLRTTNQARQLAAWLRPALVGLVVGALGCSDSTSPGDPGPSGVGSIDPGAGSFLLQSLEVRLSSQETARVDLVGSNLRVDPDAHTVALDVAIRNAGAQPLYAPALVYVGSFVPVAVYAENPDTVVCPIDNPSPCIMGFDYSAHLGDDGVLSPGETSASKEWRFFDADLVSFSFAVWAEFGGESTAAITGNVFADTDRDGLRDPGEGPFRGRIEVSGPNGTEWVAVAPDGSYRASVEVAGLYMLRWDDSIVCRCPWWFPECCSVCVTTPNPMQVVILSGPDGQPQSFAGADFGVAPRPCDPIPAVVLTDSFPLPDAIPQDPYSLLEARLDGDVFTLRVGFGGCAADHPFKLFAGRSFMESFPVQTWVSLAHDDRDEPCDAFFQRTLRFDLDPIRQEHIRQYGGPAVVGLRFRDSQGNERFFDFGP